MDQDDSDLSIYAPGSPASVSSISSTSQRSNDLLEDVEIEQDAAVLAFIHRMRENVVKYTKSLLERARPSRYKKIGKQAPRTERQHRQVIRQKTAALRAAGFSDIRNYFKTNSQTSMESGSVDWTQLNQAAEEEEAESEDNIVRNKGIPMREEEEESEDDIVENKGIPMREEEEENEGEVGPVGRQSGHSESIFSSLHPVPKTSSSTSMATASNVEPNTVDYGTEEFEDDMEKILTTELESGPGHTAPTKSRSRVTPPAPDSPRLLEVIKILQKRVKQKDLEYFTRSRTTAMIGFLQFYTTMEDIGWQEASLLAAQAAGFGKGSARNIHHMVWDLLEDPQSEPAIKLSGHKSRVHDEDFSRAIQLHLQTLGKKYFSANDIVQFLDQPEVKKQFNLKKAPTENTVQKWLKFMEYRYGPGKKGMYIDGHEREDVVQHRQMSSFLSGIF